MADITRKEWVERSTEENIRLVENMFDVLNDVSENYYFPGYTRSFIGIRKAGKPCNFAVFTPKKKKVVLSLKLTESDRINQEIELATGGGEYSYANGWYAITLDENTNPNNFGGILLAGEEEFLEGKTESTEESTDGTKVVTIEICGELRGIEFLPIEPENETFIEILQTHYDSYIEGEYTEETLDELRPALQENSNDAIDIRFFNHNDGQSMIVKVDDEEVMEVSGSDFTELCDSNSLDMNSLMLLHTDEEDVDEDAMDEIRHLDLEEEGDNERYGNFIRETIQDMQEEEVFATNGEDTANFMTALTEKIVSRMYRGVDRFVVAGRDYEDSGIEFSFEIPADEDFDIEKLKFIYDSSWYDNGQTYPDGLIPVLEGAEFCAEAIIYDGRIIAARAGSEWWRGTYSEYYGITNEALMEAEYEF